jgi:polyribonucleotide nucleotidyltransferase
LEEGEMIKVKLTGLDKKTGKSKLSRKVLLPRPQKSSSTPIKTEE